MKKVISILVCLIIISLFTIPVMAEERSVIGINTPSMGIISYEHESANNNSWFIGGLVFLDSSSINLSLSSGGRFYKGRDKDRSYKGLYGNFLYNGDQSPLQPVIGGGVDGVFGYEWRFGEARNTRVFIEAGLTAFYITKTGPAVTPVIGTGFGFNI